MFHFQRVYNPLKTFSVLEPLQPGTCMPGKAMRATVQETSRTRNCIVAANAGFFNTTSGECLGENKIIILYLRNKDNTDMKINLILHSSKTKII